MPPWQMREYMCYELLWKETRYSSIPEHSHILIMECFKWVGSQGFERDGGWLLWNCSQPIALRKGAVAVIVLSLSVQAVATKTLYLKGRDKAMPIEHTERNCLNPPLPLCIYHSNSNVLCGWGTRKGAPPGLVCFWIGYWPPARGEN